MVPLPPLHQMGRAPSDLLRETLVGRDDLRTELLDFLREGRVLVLEGPPGSGKSHLLQVILADLEEDGARRIEVQGDGAGALTLEDLIQEMLRALGSETADPLLDLDGTAFHDAAARILREELGETRLVLAIEDLDLLLEGRGAPGVEGVNRLREILDGLPGGAVLLGTARSRAEVLRDREGSLGKGLLVREVPPLTPEDVLDLFRSRARILGMEDLVDLRDPAPRGTLRALCSRAAGNPRVVVGLVEEWIRGGGEDPAGAYLRVLDLQSPSLLAPLAGLSGLQRRIVRALARHRVPVRVKDLARECRSSPGTIAKQLSLLRAREVVRCEEIGRESFHELVDSVLRDCLEGRLEGRGRRAFLDFLVRDRITAELTRGYGSTALQHDEVRVRWGRRSLEAHGDAADWNEWGEVLRHDGDLEGARRAYRRSLELDPRPCFPWFNLALASLEASPTPTALPVVEEALAARGESDWGEDLPIGYLELGLWALRDAPLPFLGDLLPVLARGAGDPEVIRGGVRGLGWALLEVLRTPEGIGEARWSGLREAVRPLPELRPELRVPVELFDAGSRWHQRGDPRDLLVLPREAREHLLSRVAGPG